jgi:hypothetical protein
MMLMFASPDVSFSAEYITAANQDQDEDQENLLDLTPQFVELENDRMNVQSSSPPRGVAAMHELILDDRYDDQTHKFSRPTDGSVDTLGPSPFLKILSECAQWMSLDLDNSVTSSNRSINLAEELEKYSDLQEHLQFLIDYDSEFDLTIKDESSNKEKITDYAKNSMLKQMEGLISLSSDILYATMLREHQELVDKGIFNSNTEAEEGR